MGDLQVKETIKLLNYWLTMQQPNHRYYDPYLPLQAFEGTKELIDKLPDSANKIQIESKFNEIYQNRLQMEKDLLTIKTWDPSHSSETKEAIEKLIETLPSQGETKAQLKAQFDSLCGETLNCQKNSQVASMINQFESLRRKQFDRNKELPSRSFYSKPTI